MTLIIPYEFTAGTKAQSAQVNADFQAVATEVNSISSDLADVETSITNLSNNKADINGSSSNRFSVANPVNNYDAVNKQTFASLCKYIIGGLKISRGDDAIISCTAGAGYDTTVTKIITLASDTSKTNDSQVASATYYVYLVGQSAGTGSDLLISTSSANPPLPTGYDLYLPLGYYTTNSDNEIDVVYGYSLASSAETTTKITSALAGTAPDWTTGVSKAKNEDHTAEEDGWIVFRSATNTVNAGWLYIDGVTVAGQSGLSGTAGAWIWLVPIAKGSIYRCEGAGSTTGVTFYKCKGV